MIDEVAFEAYHDELAAAVIRNGHSVVSLRQPRPPYGWDDTGNSYRTAYPAGSCVVVHGDLDLVCRVRGDQIWTPGVFASLEHFFCSHYFSHFGSFLLNRDYIMVPYAELPRCREFLFATLGRDDTLFVRPDSPLKLFTGLTIGRPTFDRDYEYMGFYEFPKESLVVVSSPKAIVAEWRYVIADGQVVSGSQYMERNEPARRLADDPNALAFAESVLKTGYEPDPVWVMDVCQTQDDQYRLLEIGAFSCAALYACDKDAVVQAVSAVAERLHAKRSR